MFGLPSIGNTCFMNSSIQCFLSCTKIKNELESHDKFGILFSSIQNNRVSVCKHLILEYKKMNPDGYNIFQQHDCNEFIEFFLDSLDIKSSKVNIIYENLSKNGKSGTPVESCNNVISLGVSSSLVNSIVDFSISEGETHIHRCIFDTINDVVIFHVKRRSYDMVNGQMKFIKIEDDMTINEVLYMKDKNGKTTLKLRSAIIHFGNEQSGHYVSCVNNNDEWYLIDDMKISKVNSSILLKSYILFYERVI